MGARSRLLSAGFWQFAETPLGRRRPVSIGGQTAVDLGLLSRLVPSVGGRTSGKSSVRVCRVTLRSAVLTPSLRYDRCHQPLRFLLRSCVIERDSLMGR